MTALAKSRRHRFAPVVLMMLALLFVGMGYSALTPSSAHAEDALAGADPAQGRALFVANCATCHGLEAQGTDIAPTLVGVGAASVHFQVTTGRMPMANNSPQAEIKPPQLNNAQALDLAAYIAELGPGPSIPTDEMVDPALGDPVNGLLLFRTNCAMCHNAVGAGGALTHGKLAPPVRDTLPVHIYEAMQTGPQAMPGFNDATMTPEEKRDIIAYIDAANQTNPGGVSLGSIGPVSEMIWVFLIGIGSLVGAAVWIGARSS